MTPYSKRGASRAPRLPDVADVPRWRKMLAEALACADDADRGEMDEAADLRRMHLANQLNRAVVKPFRYGGQATQDMATAFITAGRAFVRRETPQEVRRAMAHSIADMARFLDDRLHAQATVAFENHHRGRTEII